MLVVKQKLLLRVHHDSILMDFLPQPVRHAIFIDFLDFEMDEMSL